MAEVIRTWLRSRLGVIVDLSPEIFGRYCRDGTFVAKLLHSYDIINDSQLHTITQTADPALARVNLRHLRCWLRFIDVDCNDACIEDISNGKGTASLRLFYKLFLCLENKDRLHFITLQKEREKYIPNSTKFDVKVISEESPIDDGQDHPFIDGLVKESASLTNWYRKKFQKIIDDCKLEREKFRASQASNEPMKEPPFNKVRVLRPKATLKKNELTELDEFTRKHRVKCEITSSSSDLSEKSKLFSEHPVAIDDPEAAKEFIKTLKLRKSSTTATHNFKVEMQKSLLTDVWATMLGGQDREFDRVIAKKILDQSQYEKQMVKKLCDIRNQKNRMATNRQFVDELMIKSRENEMRMIEETVREDIIRDNEEVDDECRRMNELHQRIKLGKQRRTNRKSYQLTMKIVRDIVDISMKTVEFKYAYDGHIPISIRNEWKALFLKNLPIFTLSDDFNYQEGNEDEEHEDFPDVELTRRNILNERDFKNYHLLKYPWEEFMPQVDEKTSEYLHLGQLVLAHIVHKLLEYVYPPPPESIKSPLPDVKIRSIVVGIPDSSHYSLLRELLKPKKIQLFTVEDTINYCLHCYKEEMKHIRYVDIDFENKLITKLSPLTIDEVRQTKRLKKEQRKLHDKAASLLKTDKETQTPKSIPYDDTHPQLSDTAYIGKWAHETLMHGEPLPDNLVARMIYEYLKGLINIRGWALSNYPRTYDQIIHLEGVLTGRKIPNLPGKLNPLNTTNTIIQEIESTPRIAFAFEDNDSCASCRESELLPNPLTRNECSGVKTYITAFIRMLPKPQNIAHSKSEELSEIRSEDATSVDNFYTKEGLASAIYYTTCDASTLKRVVSLITGRTSSLRISTSELPENASTKAEKVLEINTESRRSSTKVQMKSSSKSIMKSSSKSLTKSSMPESDTKNEQMGLDTQLVKPGESDWIWADHYLAPEVIEKLATIWEDMEDVYIGGLKEILALKRSIFTGVVPYKDLIIHHMSEFIARPDNKQELIRQFQVIFNDIPLDMRNDNDVKCELHCRVDDFQAELWDTCDVRRREAEEERRKIINNNWTGMELMILTNIYIGIIQLEIDRFIDTMQLIQTYYLSMLKRPADVIHISKFTLRKLDSTTNNLFDNDDSFSMKHPLAEVGKGKFMKSDDDKSSMGDLPVSGVNKSDVKHEVDNILLNIDEETKIDVTQTSFYKTIQSNIAIVRSIIDDISISMNETLQSETNVLSSSRSSDRRGNKRASKKRLSDRSNQSGNRVSGHRRIQNLLQEWEYVMMFEVNRIRMRLSIIEAAKKSDIEFLLSTIRTAFTSIRQMLNEKYEREMSSADEIAKVFSLAIEQEISVQEEIILYGDEILIRPYSLMSPDNVKEPFNYIRENSHESQFKISQLGRLKDIFHRVAPSGFIPARSFIYILQDLLICPDELPVISPLPTSWYELKPKDTVELVHELFGDISYIDWREFLIYAMGMEMPSQDDLLDTKEAFANKDRDSIGIIYREQFISHPLWFISTSQSSSWRSLLNENFENDERVMFEEEFDLKSWKTMFSISGKSKKPRRNISFWINTGDKFDSLYEVQQEKMMRMTLIRELLGEMFLNSYYTFNYIAMLLAFCKDDDPIYGFGKALCIALGKRVCLDFDAGEQYLEKLLEEKRLLADEETQRIHQRQDAIKFSKEFCTELIERALESGDGVLIEIDTSSLTDSDDQIRESGTIPIERLDQPGETIDPATLLIEDAPPMHSYFDDAEDNVSFEDLDKTCSSFQSDDDIIKSRERELVYWLPINVCESVLSALLPIEVIQSNISHTKVSLIENLKLVYRDVACKELDDMMNDAALIHRMVNHPFIALLLQSTSKFTNKNLTSIVGQYLNNKENHG